MPHGNFQSLREGISYSLFFFFFFFLHSGVIDAQKVLCLQVSWSVAPLFLRTTVVMGYMHPAAQWASLSEGALGER